MSETEFARVERSLADDSWLVILTGNRGKEIFTAGTRSRAAALRLAKELNAVKWLVAP